LNYSLLCVTLCVHVISKKQNKMKKYIFLFLMAAACGIVACNPKSESNMATTSGGGSIVALPYVASYTTDFNNNVSDSDLLTVLNSYKYWEQGDMKALRTTMGDSMSAVMSDGTVLKGLADSVLGVWSKYRDSLSSVKINMVVWLKNHSIKDSIDWVNVWYIETDTFKNGKVDSAEYEDDNAIRNGKITYLSSHKRPIK
jgi:hypothetical protein